MKGLLKEGGSENASSMRFAFLLVAIGVFIILLSIAVLIILKAIKGEEPEWSALSVFAIGIAGLITGAGYTKVKQKEIEVKKGEDYEK